MFISPSPAGGRGFCRVGGRPPPPLRRCTSCRMELHPIHPIPKARLAKLPGRGAPSAPRAAEGAGVCSDKRRVNGAVQPGLALPLPPAKLLRLRAGRRLGVPCAWRCRPGSSLGLGLLQTPWPPWDTSGCFSRDGSPHPCPAREPGPGCTPPRGFLP